MKSSQMAPNPKDKWVRRFLITETSRHKKGFTVYKVTSVIYPKSAPEAVSRISIWKRYNDFRKLHSELSSKHNNLKIKEAFPSFPKPKFFRRYEAEVIEERRQCAIRLLEFIARHTALFTSNVFVKFFEFGHSIDSLATDCSLSLSSDASEDDYNLNSALRGTNYTPMLLSDIETHARDRKNIDSVTNNEIKDDPCTERLLIHNPEAKESISDPETDNLVQSVPNNNNYMEEIDSRVENTCDERRVEHNGNEKDVDTCMPVHDGSDLPKGVEEEFNSYILVAATHMSAAFRHEAVGEFGEAFTQYKLGISSLLNGVQGDANPGRRTSVKEKIAKYLERAEKLYNRHLNCNVSLLSKPKDELRNYKVLRVVGSVMLVRDTERDCNRVIKTVQKAAGSAESLSDYILRGKVPYMVRLYGCIETESTIFLVLQYASGGKLWEYMKSYHKGRDAVANSIDKGHTRSASCEAIIQSEMRARKTPDTQKTSSTINTEDVRDCDAAENAPIDPEESLRKLEEEFGANSASERNFPTTDLLAKSQELLRSVDATLKKSNSIASRLNESESLLYHKKKLNDQPNSLEGMRATNRTKNSGSSEGNSSRKATFEKEEALKSEEQEKLDKVASNSVENFEQSTPKTSSSNSRGSFENSNLMVSQERSKNPTNPKDLSEASNGISNSDQFQSLLAEDSGIEMDDELWKLPEGTIRFWAAEILITLESLHRQDVIVGELKPDNILLGNGGHVAMSYIVPRRSFQFLQLKKPYSAPELCMFSPTDPPSTAADVWSYGVLLYELFTGIQFTSKHPGPFYSHSILNIPEELSSNAKSLISDVLRYKPEDRLTIPEIMDHPFFASIDWTSLINFCFN